jgi:UDPglucose 6-dehydrogenase
MGKIGIVGLGFVGGAIYSSFNWPSVLSTVVTVDSDPSRGKNTFAELADTDGVFVCVPTPQDDDGTCDTGPLESVLLQLKALDYQGVIISKCTAPPSTYTKLNDIYPNLVHAPEFLTAANAVEDYANGTFAIIGGKVKAYRDAAEKIIRESQRQLKSVAHCSIAEASMAKYAINTFMSTKVIFMNELYRLAKASDCEFDTITNMIKMDPRIGNSHMQVPGPDGSFGFGGACFPKDTSALLKYAESVGVQLNVLEAAVKKNLVLRLTEPK